MQKSTSNAQQVFRQYLLSHGVFGENDLDTIVAEAFILHLGRKGRIDLANTPANIFVVKGCLHQFQLQDLSVERTLYVATEGHWILDRRNAGTNRKIYIEAIEETEVIMWPAVAYNSLMEKIPTFSSFHFKLLEYLLQEFQHRINSIICYLASERYEEVLHHRPELDKRVPGHILASYLGISRETLNRIRHKRAKKKS